MNESLIKYLSGLLDADGNLSFDMHKGLDGRIRISLKLSLVAADVIDQNGFVQSLPEITGMGSVTRTYDKYSCWHITHRADLEMLLPRLIKHMVIKGKHWNWMLDYWRAYRSQERGSKSLSEQEWEVLKQEAKQSRIDNVGPLKPKNHPTWAWLAGYLDGDGCYSFRTSKNKNMRLSVTCHENDVSCLEFLQNAFGGTLKKYSGKPHIKVWWRGLGPANKSFALEFLSNIVGHSRLKKHKIEQMISFHHRQRLSVSSATAEAIV